MGENWNMMDLGTFGAGVQEMKCAGYVRIKILNILFPHNTSNEA